MEVTKSVCCERGFEIMLLKMYFPHQILHSFGSHTIDKRPYQQSRRDLSPFVTMLFEQDTIRKVLQFEQDVL